MEDDLFSYFGVFFEFVLWRFFICYDCLSLNRMLQFLSHENIHPPEHILIYKSINIRPDTENELILYLGYRNGERRVGGSILRSQICGCINYVISHAASEFFRGEPENPVFFFFFFAEMFIDWCWYTYVSYSFFWEENFPRPQTQGRWGGLGLSTSIVFGAMWSDGITRRVSINTS